MPLYPPTWDEAFSARVAASATLGLMAPDVTTDGAASAATALPQALEEDRRVYAELNVLLGRGDLDEPEGACLCIRARFSIDANA